jgi:hypothetical protein
MCFSELRPKDKIWLFIHAYITVIYYDILVSLIWSYNFLVAHHSVNTRANYHEKDTNININFAVLNFFLHNKHICCTFHGLGPVACSNSELTSETMNPLRHFGRIPLTGY